ncbi:MAG: diphosphate--fructose-6-phosphate 1-phosphotransferase [Acidobacteriaceae bacterium]
MIVQGGGPTAVFNASLSCAIAEAAQCARFRKILGARSGALGLAQGDIVDLSRLSTAELKTLSGSPGAALRSSRVKTSEEDLSRQVEQMRKLDVRHLIFMGGNGTMRGAEITSAFCRAAGFEVRIIGVPKTVDNDIAATDRCPGFASAARYVAQSTRELGLDLRSLPQPVTILETMGRSVGWLAAASVLAQVEPCDAPQLVYVPEVPFSKERFLSDLDDIVAVHGWAVVVVAEGIRNQDGSLVYEIADPAQQDALKRPLTGGVGQFLAGIVAENLHIRCRSEKPGLLGRASMAHLSQQDRDDAELVGRVGVRALINGESDKMVALRPLRDSREGGCDLVPLASVAGVERALPAEWLTTGPFAVSEAFRDYLRPLIGELDQYAREFPSYSPSFGDS